jgi:hypothetical protein
MGLIAWFKDRLDDVRDTATAAGKAAFAAAGATAYLGLAQSMKFTNQNVNARRLSELGFSDIVLRHFERDFGDLLGEIRVKFGARLIESVKILGR